RNHDMNSTRRLDNSFGEGFWSLFCQQVVGCGPSLIGVLDVMGDVALDPLRRFLPPSLDLIGCPHRHFVLQTKTGQALFDHLLDQTLERDFSPLGSEAALAVEDNRKEANLLQSRG